GGLLLRRGDVRGANAAFDRALARRPGNGWVMWGKAQALAAAGDAEASRALLEKQRKAWRGTEAPTLARL
uniref:tetratricopeptide repeat protein n=1 Tax=Sphingobium phenoxybenzoativorans TaxID=1592790 RepID=UPI001112EFE3